MIHTTIAFDYDLAEKNWNKKKRLFEQGKKEINQKEKKRLFEQGKKVINQKEKKRLFGYDSSEKRLLITTWLKKRITKKKRLLGYNSCEKQLLIMKGEKEPKLPELPITKPPLRL